MMLSKLPTKTFGLILFLLAALAALAGCQRGSSQDIPDIGINLVVSPNPPQVGLATLALTLSDANGQPISGARIELEGNMSHAGMAPVFSQATEVAPGRYEAPLEFTMSGDWFILAKATLPDGRSLERQLNLPNVTP
jgi:hypothetical protein